MPILALSECEGNEPMRPELVTYELTCDSCAFQEHSGPYIPSTDEDEKSREFALRAMDLHRYNRPGHRVSLYQHVRNVFLETRVSEVRVEGVRG